MEKEAENGREPRPLKCFCCDFFSPPSSGLEPLMQSEERALIEVNSLMFSSAQEETCAPTKEPVKYGELVVLG